MDKKYYVDFETLQIRHKRPIDAVEEENTECRPEEHPEMTLDKPILEENAADSSCEVFRNALEVIESHGRGDDFKSLLIALADGTLDPTNIALHLLLDIGNVLSKACLTEVRYNKTTLDFWSLVHKLFKRKATRFFRGPMSSELETRAGEMFYDLHTHKFLIILWYIT